MKAKRDERVAEVQQWLNDTYGKYEPSGRFNTIEVNGKTGWPTIYALRRALQIELGITQTSDAFGPTTYRQCPAINQGSEGNLVYIVQEVYGAKDTILVDSQVTMEMEHMMLLKN